MSFPVHNSNAIKPGDKICSQDDLAEQTIRIHEPIIENKNEIVEEEKEPEDEDEFARAVDHGDSLRVLAPDEVARNCDNMSGMTSGTGMPAKHLNNNETPSLLPPITSPAKGKGQWSSKF